MAGFRGGVHPPSRKRYTSGLPIAEVFPPDTVVIPLQQHIGAPCVPCVEPGAVVAAGQLIGRSAGAVSAPVHASVAGVVKAIGRAPHPGGRLVPAVVVAIDREATRYGWTARRTDDLSPSDILSAIAEAGIVGMGGAGYPTAAKLAIPPGKTVDTLIVNGCECEPYLTADHRLMAEQPVLVAEGMALVMRVLGVRRAILAIEDDKPDAVRALRMATWPAGAEIGILPARYPQGAEKLLVLSLLGRHVPPGKLPIDVGAVVQNVATVAVIARAVRYGEPLIRRIVTVTGPGIREPANWRAPIGMSVGDLVAASGGMTADAGAIVLGGPMMGATQATLDTPVTKTTSGIIVLAHGAAEPAPHACLHCGRCVRACPMGLVPIRLARAARFGRLDRFADLGARDCLECGCCAYVCPVGRSLIAWVRQGKADLARMAAVR